MPGIQCVDQVERFRAAHFADDEAVGPMTERRFHKVADGHGWLLAARLELKPVRRNRLYLPRVFEDAETFLRQNFCQ